MAQPRSNTAPKRRFPRQFAERAGLILLGCGLALGIFEISIRAAWSLFGKAESSQQIDPYCLPVEVVPLRAGESFTGYYQFDEVLMRRWVPGVRGIIATSDDGTPIVYAANEHGWRDVPHTLEKPAGMFRIAVIGDSFGLAFHRPLEEAIPRQLEAWLNTQGLAHPVEVINLSLEGNTPVEYSLINRYEAPRFDPDLVVVLLFTFNDVPADLPERITEVEGHLVYTEEVIDGMRTLYEEVTNGPGGDLTWADLEAAHAEGRLVVTQEAPDGTRSYAVRLPHPYVDAPPELQFHCFLDRVSRAYTWLKTRLRPLLATEATVERSVTGMIVYESPPGPEMEAAWVLFERLLAQMAGDAAAHDTPIIFVILANGDQVYEPLFSNGLARLGLSPDNHEPTYPISRTEAICARHDLTCWFMLPDFQQAAVTTDEQLFEFYVPGTPDAWYWGHYTAFGDALVAQAVGSRILEMTQLVPRTVARSR